MTDAPHEPLAPTSIEPVMIDPVDTPIDQLDLTNPFIAHSVVTRLQDEARYWRQNAACWLSSALHDRGRMISPGQLAYEQGPDRRVREFGSALSDALNGQFYPGCEGCDAEVRPGDPVINCADVGEMHAACMSATPAQIAAGSMSVPFESLDTDDLSEDQISAVREDPRLHIYPNTPLFTPERIAAYVVEAAALRDSQHADTALQHTPLYAAIDLLASERIRQVSEEGWTPEHDVGHDGGELAAAALCYIRHATAEDDQRARFGAQETAPHGWPWSVEWWKPTAPDRDMVKGGALLLAELERIARAADAA